jgi:hypothetical protein
MNRQVLDEFSVTVALLDKTDENQNKFQVILKEGIAQRMTVLQNQKK